jgi:hypothetical protein
VSQEVAGSSLASSIEYIYPTGGSTPTRRTGRPSWRRSPKRSRAATGMVLPDGSTLARPTNVKLARRLGIASEPSLAPS